MQADRVLIGARLRDVRVQRMLTQEELSQQTGLSAAHISSIERGKGMSLDSVIALSDALNVSLDYVIRGIRPQMGAWGLIFRSDEDLDDDARIRLSPRL